MKAGNDEQRALIRSAIVDGGRENMAEIQAAIEATGALDYTARCARDAADAAIAAISKLPENPCRQALVSLAEFAVSRRS